MTSAGLPDRGQGRVLSACFCRVSGALWLGCERGALARMPGEASFRHLPLGRESILACTAGPKGVWLAGEDTLFAPDPRGSGVRRVKLLEVAGRAVCVTGMAADRTGVWLAVRGLRAGGPSLLRLPETPPVFQRYTARLDVAEDPLETLAGDGERAWAMGHTWITELEDRTVGRAVPTAEDTRAGGRIDLLGSFRDASAPLKAIWQVPDAEEHAAALGEELAVLGGGRWLRARPGGLVGRNANGLFCLGHDGGKPYCPELPGRLDHIACDWYGLPQRAMLIGSPSGAYYVTPQRNLRLVAPGEPVVTILPGSPPVIVTRFRAIDVTEGTLAVAPAAVVDLVGAALQLARSADPNRPARLRTAEARVYALVGDGTDVPRIEQLLDDVDRSVREAACVAAARRAGPRVRELLFRRLGDESLRVQILTRQLLVERGELKPQGVTA